MRKNEVKMGVITELRRQKGKKARFSVFLDNQFVCGMDEFCIYKYRLCEGKEINLDELQNIQLEAEGNIAFETAVSLISKNARTEKQMRDYLSQKGYMPVVVDNVIQKLIEYRYINDQVFAEDFWDNYKNHWGKRKIKFALLQKGVAEDTIEQLLENTNNQQEAIIEISKKYMKNKDNTRENYEKLARHLASRGFSWEDINSALSRIKSGEIYESWD